MCKKVRSYYCLYKKIGEVLEKTFWVLLSLTALGIIIYSFIFWFPWYYSLICLALAIAVVIFAIVIVFLSEYIPKKLKELDEKRWRKENLEN